MNNGALLASFAVAVPSPHDELCNRKDVGTNSSRRPNNSSSTLHWVEKLCWSDDGRWLAAAAGRAVVVVGIKEVPDDEDITRKCLRAEVIRRVENTKDFGTVSDIASMSPIDVWQVEAKSTSETVQPADCGHFVIAGYGGVSCFRPHEPEEQLSSPQLEIGATATLVVATSPDKQLVAVGCLDKRMRIFELHKDDMIGRTSTDWVGFDGPVASVTWSATGKWIAAAGGTALLVVPHERLIPRTAIAGRRDPPIRCIVPGGMARGEGISTFGEITWCSGTASAGAVVCEESLLAAIERPTGRVYLYSVAAQSLDGGVPRHAAPLLSLDPPGKGTGALQQCSSIGHVAFATKCGKDNLDSSEHRIVVVLVVSHGDWSMAVRVELPSWQVQMANNT